MSETDAEYGLVVSFEDQSASYVHGFEAGTLKARMCDEASAEDIEGERITVHTANRITIDRMCTAYGWQAQWEGTEYPEWSYLTLNRAPKPTERPNPHGLRVVSSDGPSEAQKAQHRHDYWEREGAPGAA